MMNSLTQTDFHVPRFGTPQFDSPVLIDNYTAEEARFLYNIDFDSLQINSNKYSPLTIERSGPRKKIFFNPVTTRAGIITCGGLCPGLNNVIRALTVELVYQYKIESVTGYRYGYLGLADPSIASIHLTPEVVNGISDKGGTILGSSRGPQNIDRMVERLIADKINILFVIGGDGALKGAEAIFENITKRGLPISIIGIPKSIDNDLNFISKTFGFETAYSKAVEAIKAVHIESLGAPNGVGLVKVMGRHSGAIACHATISSNEVNFCLIPELSVDLYGNGGFLEALELRLKNKDHAVVVVAEGAFQEIINKVPQKDPSGNIKLADSGSWLKNEIINYFSKKNIEINLKYIDPSYLIRAIPASPDDSLFCTILSQYAVHTGMSGRTGVVIGQWNHLFANLPIKLVIKERKIVNLKGSIWRAVMESTGQNL